MENITGFRSLLAVLSAMLFGLSANTGSRRAKRFSLLAESIWDCRTFEQITQTLAGAPHNRELRRRVERMRASNGLRLYLSGEADSFLCDWYAMYSDDLPVTQRIANMANELADAYCGFVNFGIEPCTGHWHDNQCALWQLLIGERQRHDSESVRCRQRPQAALRSTSLIQAAFSAGN